MIGDIAVIELFVIATLAFIVMAQNKEIKELKHAIRNRVSQNRR